MSAEFARERKGIWWIAPWIIGVLLVALYAYATVAAVGNYVGVSSMLEFLGMEIRPIAWVLLVAGVAIPAIALAVSLLLGRRKTPVVRLLLLGTGLCVTAALQLEIMHLIS